MEHDSSCDVSTEIEVTPAMIEAGVERYLDLVGEVDSVYAVVEVYRAMAGLSPELLRVGFQAG